MLKDMPRGFPGVPVFTYQGHSMAEMHRMSRFDMAIIYATHWNI